MASPVGHSLAGLAVGQFGTSRSQRDLIVQLSLTVVMANLPDFDFLPGLILNSPALFHGDGLHSLTAAVIISLAVAGLLRHSGRPFRETFILALLGYLTHLGLDLMRPDGRPPIGIPLFWPWSERYFISPVSILMSIHHASTTSATTMEFIRGVLSTHNLRAILLEIALLTPFVILGAVVRRWFYRGVEKSDSDIDIHKLQEEGRV